MNRAMAARINIPFNFLVLRRRIQSAFRVLTKAAVFVAIAIGGGLLSSWYAVEGGMAFNTERQGPWTRWSAAGRPDADPYSRTRFSRRGQLLFNAEHLARFEATTDDRGRRLHSSCDYVIEGRDIGSPWWSLAVFNSDGNLIENPAGRFGFNTSTVAYSLDGSFAVRLAREARPYNWLPTTRAGNLVVIFELERDSGGASDIVARENYRLPTITRLACR